MSYKEILEKVKVVLLGIEPKETKLADEEKPDTEQKPDETPTDVSVEEKVKELEARITILEEEILKKDDEILKKDEALSLYKEIETIVEEKDNLLNVKVEELSAKTKEIGDLEAKVLELSKQPITVQTQLEKDAENPVSFSQKMIEHTRNMRKSKGLSY